MAPRILSIFIVLAVVAALMTSGASADDRTRDITRERNDPRLISTFPAGKRVAPDGTKLVPIIVKLDEMAVASYDGSIEGLPPTSPAVLDTGRLRPSSAAVRAYLAYLAEKHDAFVAELERVAPGAVVTAHFYVAFGGVAALVPPRSVEAIAKLPDVVAVFTDEIQPLDRAATRSRTGWGTTGIGSPSREGRY